MSSSPDDLKDQGLVPAEPKPAVQFDQDFPLHRIEVESDRAHRALMDFALMGVSRSLRGLLGVYEKRQAIYEKYIEAPDQHPPGQPVPQAPPSSSWQTITQWSASHGWVARCRRFDEIQLELERLEYEGDRVKVRKSRVEALKTLQTRLMAALAQLNPKDATWSDISNGLIKVTEALRTEYGDKGADEAPRGVKMVVVKVKGRGAGGGLNIKNQSIDIGLQNNDGSAAIVRLEGEDDADVVDG